MTNGWRTFIYSLIVLVPFLLFTQSSDPENDFMDICDAANQKKIKVELTGLGGYSDSCVAMQITNLTDESIKIRSQAGLRLLSEDKSEQDILVVKEGKFKVAPLATIKTKVFGFCCQSHNAAPGKGSKFKLGGMAVVPLAKLAHFLSTGKFKSRDMQSAIWSISDGHSIGSLRRNDRESYRLLEVVSAIKGVDIPWYTVSYRQNTDTLSVFNRTHNVLNGRFKYQVPTQCVISLLVLNENGHVVKILQRGKLIAPGEHVQNVNMKVDDLPRGQYKLVIKTAENRFVEKKTFEL